VETLSPTPQCLNGSRQETLSPEIAHKPPTGSFRLRFQPVDATHWLNRSAGVS
jgi:hypothetical protein